MLYDCIIVKDLSNHIEYNYAYKYYLKCDYRADFYKHPSNMILYFGKTDISQYENKFIPAYTAVKKEYEIHIDENDVEYLFFKYKRFLPDGTLEYNYAKDFFYSDSGNFYNTLSPYFEILEETLESDGDLIQYAGIRLDILIQLEINE